MRLPRFYAVLGVARDASPRDVARAYRLKSLAWHPDRWRGESAEKQELACSRFRVVADAYDTLRDSSRRAAYDARFS